MTRALILDCDGVLADTELDGHLVAFNRVFDELGLSFQWSADEYGELLRVGGGKERFKAYLGEHPEFAPADSTELDALVADVHKRKSAAYVEIMGSGSVPGRPGVRRLIAEALDAGWLVAVASTSALGSVEAVLDTVIGADLRSRLAGVFAGDVVPAKKPAPDIYLLALDTLGLAKDEAVVIEDSWGGAQAAAAAGLAHIVTVSHFTADDDFPAATSVVSDLGEAGAPSITLRGPDLTRADGTITVASLEAALAA